jgi:signal transduction histidine kinase/ActR/RegA family two-component response regulator
MLLPTSRDADLTRELLERNGLHAWPCTSAAELAAELEQGAGALLVAEECLAAPAQALLAHFIEAQPRWSDIPVILLTREGADSLEVGDAVAMLGNVTLLERPLRVTALVSTLQSALRARRRQYEIQSHLRDLEEARDAELLATRRKDEFLAMLAHELRNPLAPIRNALHVLALDDGDPRVRSELRAMMGRQVDHMVRLVDDLLEASRLSRGMITLHREPMDLCAALRSAIELCRPVLEARQCRIDTDLCDEGLAVRADPVRIAQVFGNLLNNAAKYGRIGGHVEVHGRSEGETAVVEVVDDGVGISREDLPHVFDLFVQGKGDADRMHEGLGIGLALVRTLVQLHGGTVTAHSAGKDRGACFQVRLPLSDASARGETEARDSVAFERRTSHEADLEHEAGVAGSYAPASPRSPTAATGYRVLVVDDNADAATSLAMVLRARGMEVRIANDGSQALVEAEVFRPDAILLDIGMPLVDGYEVARRLRQDPRNDAVLLVAITGWSRLQDRQRGRAAGFDHHFRKPVDLPRLCALLESRRNELALARAV